jgi:hypothetical protein
MPEAGSTTVWLLEVKSSTPSAPVEPLENVCPTAAKAKTSARSNNREEFSTGDPPRKSLDHRLAENSVITDLRASNVGVKAPFDVVGAVVVRVLQGILRAAAVGVFCELERVFRQAY